MSLYSRYLSLTKGPYIGTLRPKYVLHGYMKPKGIMGNAGFVASTVLTRLRTYTLEDFSPKC